MEEAQAQMTSGQVDNLVTVTDQYAKLVTDLGIPAVVILLAFMLLVFQFWFTRRDTVRQQKQDDEQQKAYVSALLEGSKRIDSLENKVDILLDRRKEAR